MKKAVIVVGTRTYDDYDKVSEILNKMKVDESFDIISGGASGADSLAERYAKENLIKSIIIKPDWNKYGKKGGYERNKQMHILLKQYEERYCVCFWDGKSVGTTHNFKLSKEISDSKLLIYNYTTKNFLKINSNV